MTVKEIIIKYLKDNGYDGLCSDDCGCDIDDLFPCGENPEFCIPAHKCKCNSQCKEYSACYLSVKTDKCWKED
jgi:hypothetical protein